MSDQENSVEPTSNQSQPTTITELFGNEGDTPDDGDLFAQLGSTGQDPFDQIADSLTQQVEPPQEEETLLAEATQSAVIIPPQQDEHPSPPPADELSAPPTDETPALPQTEEASSQPTVDEQDFSDLLAEFEAEKELDPQVLSSTGDETSEVAQQPPSNITPVHAGAPNENSNGGDQNQSGGQSGVLQVPIAASALFTDDPTDSFADLIPQDPADDAEPTSSGDIETKSRPASPSPVPSLSIEHSQADARPTGLGIDAAGDTSFQSMFSDASNWLGDTTFDDSIQIVDDNAKEDDGSHTQQQVKKEDDGHELLDFEVPQGWYDESGTWHWYTDEEKEQVRKTMLGQGSWGEEAVTTIDKQTSGQNQTPIAPYSPALQAGVSENAARRTPQPETPSKLPSNSFDPYAPSTAQQSATSTAYPMTSTSQYTSSSSGYEPYSGISSAAPYSSSSSYTPYNLQASTQTPYNAYAPAHQQQHNPYTHTAQAPSNPYGPAVNTSSHPYTPAPAILADAPQPPTVTSKSVSSKPPVQRMTSNAYDPPFLKPQKSFVRAPSAAASPSLGMPHSMAMSPPQASSTPPPPPSGPPKRTKPEGRPPSRGPAFAAPPIPIERAGISTTAQQNHMSAYDAPPRPPSVSYSQHSVDLNDDQSPKKPLHRPPPSAFDPPLPEPSFRAPSRTTSAASHHNYASPLQPASHPPKFAPPPKASESTYGPPRPLSRGPPARQASPMFAARPPSRPDVTQRMRSPPSSTQSLGGEQLLSPPKVQGQITDYHSRSSLDEQRRPSFESTGHQSHYGGYQPHQDHFTQSPPSQSERHLSPPVLSRKFDEDGEDGDVVEDLYSPLRAQAIPSLHQEQYRMPTSPQPPRVDSYEKALPPARKTTSEDPYAPSSLGLQTQYSPEKAQSSTSPYASYAPSQPSPEERAHASASHYASYEPTPGVIDLNDDHSNPPQRNGNYSNDPYAPSASGISPTKSQGFGHASQPSRASTMYEPSIYSPPTATKPLSIPQATNPYAPPPARTASPAYSAGYGISPPTNNYFQPMHAPSHSMDETYIPQQVLEQKPVSEDPLGRTTLAARNAPIAVFGFGGTLITAFPGAAESGTFHKGHSRIPSYGYASGRGQLWIRSISEVAAPAALKSDQTSFPGPLVFDPSTPKGAAGDKNKREAVLEYLNARAEEIEKGLPYLKSSANKARREEEGRLVLIKALKALVIGGGKLAGTPEVEEALREALANPTSPIISTVPVGTVSAGNFSSSLYPPASTSSAAPAAATATQLTRISSLLAQGNKRDAALYAADQGLWSHALVISSNVDVELWRDIVTRFTTSEVGERPQGTAGIKASYLLSGGVNPTIVDELVKAATITDDPSNDQWREVIGSVLFNAKPTELACLDELGSKFLSMGLVNAAHACFLLSPLSPFFDLTPAAFERPITLTHNVRDEEAIIFAEIAEYARSLVPTPKGQEAHFAALPQLLPYKLARAWRLAELGEAEMAQKYCAAIEAGSRINKNLPSLLSPAYAASVEDLLERLTGAPSINPPNALGSGRKAAKPGFDKLGSWIEGRLTKFIAGEEGDGTAPKPTAQSGKTAGPFSQFSTISTGTSGAPSRNTSIADLSNNSNGYLGVSSVSRTTSPALQMTPQWGQQPNVPSYGGSSSSSSYGGDNYPQHDNAGGCSPWTGNNDDQGGVGTPHAYGDDSDFINPMAQLNLGPSPAPAPPSSNYQPPKNKSAYEEDDEDDLGFGNSALSRDRTPKPPAAGEENDDKKGKGKAPDVKDSKPEPKKNDPPPAKPEHKSSWLGRIWGGKKEGEQTGPVKANLGEESSMIFDPELKRWVVKGAKPEPAGPSAPPPPPRAQTASPSRSARPDNGANNRAMSATPPPGHRPPVSGPPIGKPMGAGFAEGPDGSIKRMKSSLNESLTASDLPSAPPPPPSSGPPSFAGAGGPPKPPSSAGLSVPPSRTNSSTTPSIDDLLSRPPSKRPASAAAKKGARNRYVDVFQQPEGQ